MIIIKLTRVQNYYYYFVEVSALCNMLVGSTELESVRRVTGNIVSNQVSFLLKPDDNNAEYTCNATNDATTEPLLTTVNLRVSCTLQSILYLMQTTCIGMIV